jgi:hypothetical protein
VARGLALVVGCWLGAAAIVHAQEGATTRQPPREQAAGKAGQPGVDVDELPISVERIQKELSRQPALDPGPSRPIFRLEIFGERRTLLGPIDWLGSRDGRFRAGGPAWHDQFLAMVTPPEAQSFGAFTGGELLQVAVTSFAQALATRGIVGAVTKAIRTRRERQAEAEVDAAIAAWKAERAADDRPADGPVDASPPGSTEPDSPDGAPAPP